MRIDRILLAAGIFLMMTNMAAAQETTSPQHAESKGKQRWVGAYCSSGRHQQIWSENDYEGYKNFWLAAFMEWETGELFSLPVDTQRTVRAELRYSRIWGDNVPLDEEQVTDEQLRQGPPWYTDLDHHQLSLMLLRRWVFLPDRAVRPSLLLGFGLSVLNRDILVNGTLWNYNFAAGGGLEADINDHWTVFGDARWEHFSNGGKIYLTNKMVIGLESINMVLGIRRTF